MSQLNFIKEKNPVSIEDCLNIRKKYKEVKEEKIYSVSKMKKMLSGIYKLSVSTIGRICYGEGKYSNIESLIKKYEKANEKEKFLMEIKFNPESRKLNDLSLEEYLQLKKDGIITESVKLPNKAVEEIFKYLQKFTAEKLGPNTTREIYTMNRIAREVSEHFSGISTTTIISIFKKTGRYKKYSFITENLYEKYEKILERNLKAYQILRGQDSKNIKRLKSYARNHSKVVTQKESHYIKKRIERKIHIIPSYSRSNSYVNKLYKYFHPEKSEELEKYLAKNIYIYTGDLLWGN